MTLVSKLIRVSWSEEGESEGGRGGGGGGGRVAVTHSPGSVCNQAAEAGGSIRPSLSSAPACTSKTCVISNHTWKQERLGHAHAHTHTHTHTQSDVCAVTHTNWLQQSHMRTLSQRGADTAHTVIHSVALLSVCAAPSCDKRQRAVGALIPAKPLWVPFT